MTHPSFADEPPPQRGGSRRGSPALAVLAVVVGFLILTVGLVMLFARSQILSEEGLRDRSLTALDDPAVRERLSDMITVQVRDRIPERARAQVTGDMVSQAVDRAIEQPTFRTAFGAAVKGARRLLVDHNRSEIRLPLGEIADVLTPRLAQIDPQIAAQTGELLRGDSILIVRNDDLETVARTIQLAEVLGILLPIVAALCFVLAFLVARRRTNIVTGIGVAVLAAGIVIVIAGYVGRRAVTSMASDTDSDIAEAVWSAFAGSLSTWGIVTAVAGGVILLAGLVTALVSGRNRYLART